MCGQFVECQWGTPSAFGKIEFHLGESSLLESRQNLAFRIDPAQELVHYGIVVRIHLDFHQERGFAEIPSADIEHERDQSVELTLTQIRTLGIYDLHSRNDS